MQPPMSQRSNAMPGRLAACGALIAASLMATPAMAAVYALVQTAPDEITVLDPAAIEVIPGAMEQRRSWTVSVKKNLVSGGPPQPGYVRTLNEYDCITRRVRWRSFDVYSRFGALVMHKDNADQAWQGSDADPGLRTVCDHNGGGSVVSASSLTQLVVNLMENWDEAAPLPPLQPYVPPKAAKPSATAKSKAKTVPQR
jgi:hypothetical protein